MLQQHQEKRIGRNQSGEHESSSAGSDAQGIAGPHEDARRSGGAGRVSLPGAQRPPGNGGDSDNPTCQDQPVEVGGCPGVVELAARPTSQVQRGRSRARSVGVCPTTARRCHGRGDSEMMAVGT